MSSPEGRISRMPIIENIQQVFALALDTFAGVAETTRAMVEEQAIDLALIEAQRLEIDRKQAENRILLRELVGQE